MCGASRLTFHSALLRCSWKCFFYDLSHNSGFGILFPIGLNHTGTSSASGAEMSKWLRIALVINSHTVGHKLGRKKKWSWNVCFTIYAVELVVTFGHWHTLYVSYRKLIHQKKKHRVLYENIKNINLSCRNASKVSQNKRKAETKNLTTSWIDCGRSYWYHDRVQGHRG